MDYHILTEYNFTEPEIEVLRILIEHGESTVSNVLEQTSLSRTSVHDALNSLIVKDLLEYRKEGRNAYYKAVHPNKLYTYIEEKKQAVSRLNAEMEEVIRGMIGSYNLSESKPGVRFFEGVEGIREVLWDSLNATETIFTIGDMEMTLREYPELNNEYLQERKHRGIYKKAITRDTPFLREVLKNYDTSLTNIKLLTDPNHTYESIIIEMYNDTVSFVTLKQETLSGVIINSPQIAAAQKFMFQTVWDHAAS